MRDTVLGPLGSDERDHGYRPIASSTQRAKLRLSTSRCMRSSAFSWRSRANSARSSSLTGPWPFSRPRRSALTQLPSVPALTPSSRATSAIGRYDSCTSRTALYLKSTSNFLRVSAIAYLLSGDVSTLRRETQTAGPLDQPGGHRERAATADRTTSVSIETTRELECRACRHRFPNSDQV